MILNECTLKWFKIDERAKIPTKTDAAAGYDIYTIEDNITIPAHTTYMFRTGLAVAPSEGYWLMAFDRGSTGSKGLHVHCGVVDNDYRGEIIVALKNTSFDSYEVKNGDRIAQIVFLSTIIFDDIIAADDLSKSERGIGGFGSTGNR